MRAFRSYAANDTDAAAKTLNGGTDLELGDSVRRQREPGAAQQEPQPTCGGMD